MTPGVGHHCELFLRASATWNRIRMHGYLVLGLLHISACAYAQQYGPVPPRPQQFAGATLIQPARANFRQRTGSARVVPETVDLPQLTHQRRPQPSRKLKSQFPQPQIVDHQRTNLIDDVSAAPFAAKTVAPTPLAQFQTATPKLTPRPVEEDVNEGDELPTTIVTTPSTTAYTVPVRSSYPPAPVPAPVPVQQNIVPGTFQRSQFIQPSAFRPAVHQPVQPVPFASAPALPGRQLVRQQTRPVQGIPVPANRPPLVEAVPLPGPADAQPSVEDDLYFRQPQSRPLKKQEPVRQQVIDRQPPRQQPARSQLNYERPASREPHVKAPHRERKPVAQTIRKYHEEHEDGSITWGYENDDGSFKEETIGVDCVTRGKYGYYDPDGVKREYTYQTGIPCNKAQESEEAASNQGFIDYTNNKYVFPNGDEIDLEAMVKNRARKPVSRYNNRA